MKERKKAKKKNSHLAVRLDVLKVAKSELLDGLDDVRVAAVLAHLLGGEVRVAPGPVPVSRDGLPCHRKQGWGLYFSVCESTKKDKKKCQIFISNWIFREFVVNEFGLRIDKKKKKKKRVKY